MTGFKFGSAFDAPPGDIVHIPLTPTEIARDAILKAAGNLRPILEARLSGATDDAHRVRILSESIGAAEALFLAISSLHEHPPIFYRAPDSSDLS